MNRVFRLLTSVAIATAAAAPLAAQQGEQGQQAARMSDTFTFLEAVRNGDAALVRSIASNPSSAAINARDPSSGEGALHLLMEQRDRSGLSFLLSRGARPNLQSNDGTTPLALAAQLGWIDGAELLLARGARVDLANRRGETPLILAVQARQLSTGDRLAMVDLLLRHGADPRRQDAMSGYSALDYAKRDGRIPEIVRVLEASPQRNGAGVGPNP